MSPLTLFLVVGYASLCGLFIEDFAAAVFSGLLGWWVWLLFGLPLESEEWKRGPEDE